MPVWYLPFGLDSELPYCPTCYVNASIRRREAELAEQQKENLSLEEIIKRCK